MHKFTLLILLIGCTGAPGPAPIPPGPTGDYTASCTAADTNIQKVCPARAMTPGNKKHFKDFCIEMMSKGQQLNPDCIATATDCASADACYGSK